MKRTKLKKHVKYMSNTKQERHTRENNSNSNNNDKRIIKLRKKIIKNEWIK